MEQSYMEIVYTDLTPCDYMHEFVSVETPEFVNEDTPKLDNRPPLWTCRVPTPSGWCIVAKWENNGSTRIYALDFETLINGRNVLTGKCDIGICVPASDEIRITFINSKEEHLFKTHYFDDYLFDETITDVKEKDIELSLFQRSLIWEVMRTNDWHALSQFLSKVQWRKLQQIAGKSQRFRYDYFANGTKELRTDAIAVLALFTGIKKELLKEINDILKIEDRNERKRKKQYFYKKYYGTIQE